MSRESRTLNATRLHLSLLMYRRGLMALIISLILSTVLGLLIFRIYVTMPERSYYATSGVTPPIKLKALLAPNSSSVPLLAPDPPTDRCTKRDTE